MIEALDDFIQKSSHNETLGDRNWNTAGAQIEKLVFVDLTGSRPVGATDVVGENFEARYRIGFCIVTQQKVANLLIRIGEMGMRLYSDQSTENCAGAIVEGIFVQEIARGMRRDVVLQRARIEFLLVFGDRDSKQIAAAAFAGESAETFEARISRAKIQVQAHRRGIMIDRCRVHLQRDDIVCPVLSTHVGDLRAGAGDEIVYAARKTGRMFIHRVEMFDHGDLGKLVGDQEQMRKRGIVFTIQPMENLDWQLDFDAAWHVKKCS